MPGGYRQDRQGSNGTDVPVFDPVSVRRRAPVAGVSIAMCVTILTALTVAVETSSVSDLDRRIELLVHADVSGNLYGLMAALSFVGQSGSLAVLAFAGAVYYLRVRDWVSAAVVVTCPTGAGILDSVTKELIHRHRPHLWPHAGVINSYSFPSGHATISSAFFAGISYVAWRRFGPRFGTLTAGFSVAMTLGIGFSRIYLGVHWPSDVLAGYALGLAWAVIVMVAAQAVRTRRTAARASVRQEPAKHPVRQQVQ